MSFEKPSRASIHSHRQGIGWAIIAYKKVWQRVIGPVLDSVLEFEREQILRAVTAHVDGLVQALDRRQGALETDLIALSERVRRLEAEGGPADDVRLTNAAVLDGRERLAELRGEVELLRDQLKGASASTAGNGGSRPAVYGR